MQTNKICTHMHTMKIRVGRSHIKVIKGIPDHETMRQPCVTVANVVNYHAAITNYFVYAPSQCETTLPCNVISYWLGAYTRSSLQQLMLKTCLFDDKCQPTIFVEM